LSLLRTRTELTDLRRVGSRKLRPLFDEEVREWSEQLRWDYQPSINLIRSFIDAHTLLGYVAWQNGEPAGYGFYVIEERKGLIGGLHVSPRFAQREVARLLLREILTSLRHTPHVNRVEAQLMPSGTNLDDLLAEENFHLHHRLFMLLEIGPEGLSPAPPATGLKLEPWNDRWLPPAARLIRLAYENHVDGEINDQYRSEAGANRFLRNIVFLRGCGEFLPHASFVLASPQSAIPVGLVLTSAVAPGVGHTTQICVLPGYQGHGLGRQLLQTSIEALARHGFNALSLTVTSVNRSAVCLYERMGFRTLRRFSAGVWKA
jgi:ribosomal protein S18 acetylase RimI-like enzyme